MQVDMDVDSVDAYSAQVADFSGEVSRLMSDLQSAISRAEGSWQDESIDIARERAQTAAKNLSALIV